MRVKFTRFDLTASIIFDIIDNRAQQPGETIGVDGSVDVGQSSCLTADL